MKNFEPTDEQLEAALRGWLGAGAYESLSENSLRLEREAILDALHAWQAIMPDEPAKQ